MTDLIFSLQSLPKPFCTKLIKRFDSDFAELSSARVTGREDWADEDAVLFEKLSLATNKYLAKLKKKKLGYAPFTSSSVSDTGYLLQKFPKKASEAKPSFWLCDDNRSKRLTYFWFLNDVNKGGEVEFSTGLKIAPKAGLLVLFPATWAITYKLHEPVSEDRYMCLGNMF
jgi:hypothetical protein